MGYLRPKMAILWVLLLLGAPGWAGTLPARAHGDIERSDPMADAVIPVAPAEVHIWFSQELFRREGANVIEVSGPDGTRVDGGDTQIDDDDRTHVFVSLQPDLSPGLYTVSWRNLSVEDGHEGSGAFSFTVEPAAGEAAPQSSPPATQQEPAETPTQSPVPTPAPPASGGLPCLSGFLLSSVALGVVISRRRAGEEEVSET